MCIEIERNFLSMGQKIALHQFSWTLKLFGYDYFQVRDRTKKFLSETNVLIIF